MIRSSIAAYHLTARANNKDWYALPLTEIWSVYEHFLIRTAERYRILLHAFVLMVNHFHLIASAPERNLSEAMRYLLTEVSREIGRRSNRINHIFGGRHRWTVLWGPQDLAYVYKYVIRNPVRAGICERVEQYDFSTFARLFRGSCDLPIVDGFDELWRQIPRPPEERIHWLNTAPHSDAESLISVGLRHYQFALPSHKAVAPVRRELALSYGVEVQHEPKSN